MTLHISVAIFTITVIDVVSVSIRVCNRARLTHVKNTSDEMIGYGTSLIEYND